MLAANQKLIAMMREAGIATHLYTNDADQNLCLRGKGGEDPRSRRFADQIRLRCMTTENLITLGKSA